MATDKMTIEALERIARKLIDLGVKSEDLKILNRHIGQQKREMNIWHKKRDGKSTYRTIRR